MDYEILQPIKVALELPVTPPAPPIGSSLGPSLAATPTPVVCSDCSTQPSFVPPTIQPLI